MKLDDLEAAVAGHGGEFLCERIRNPKNTCSVRFAHRTEPPFGPDGSIPDVGRLRDFFDTFGSVTFYVDEVSGDAARRIASSSEWARLKEEFLCWLDGMDAEEFAEFTPDWIGTCIAIGETPASGNYLLMPTEGPESGCVFEFDHDGLEFERRADDLVEYATRIMAPDDRFLTNLASHLRFSDGEWWIREMRDNRGHVAKTRT